MTFLCKIAVVVVVVVVVKAETFPVVVEGGLGLVLEAEEVAAEEALVVNELVSSGGFVDDVTFSSLVVVVVGVVGVVVVGVVVVGVVVVVVEVVVVGVVGVVVVVVVRVVVVVVVRVVVVGVVVVVVAVAPMAARILTASADSNAKRISAHIRISR